MGQAEIELLLRLRSYRWLSSQQVFSLVSNSSHSAVNKSLRRLVARDKVYVKRVRCDDQYKNKWVTYYRYKYQNKNEE